MKSGSFLDLLRKTSHVRSESCSHATKNSFRFSRLPTVFGWTGRPAAKVTETLCCFLAASPFSSFRGSMASQEDRERKKRT